MKKLITAVYFILMQGYAYTQSTPANSSEEFMHTLSSSPVMVKQIKLTSKQVEQLKMTEPKNEEDMKVLGEFLDIYPEHGRKVAMNIKDPKLTKSVIKECKRQIERIKLKESKDWDKLPKQEKEKRFDSLLNAYTLFAVLGNLKNKEAIPFLKQYITPEYDNTLSYHASQAIGKISPDDPAIFKELWDKGNEVQNISYYKYGKSVLREVAEKLQNPKIPKEEKNKILAKARISGLGGRDPEEKALLKDILLHHPDEYLRAEASIAMVHAMQNRKDPDDLDFLMEWTKDVNEESTSFALYCIRDRWDRRFIPVLIKFLKESNSTTRRSRAAEILGQNKISESLPYLEECILKDKDSTVRGSCQYAYWQITDRIPLKFHPDDVRELEEYYSRSYVIESFKKKKMDNPNDRFSIELKKALEQWKKQQGVK